MSKQTSQTYLQLMTPPGTLGRRFSTSVPDDKSEVESLAMNVKVCCEEIQAKCSEMVQMEINLKKYKEELRNYKNALVKQWQDLNENLKQQQKDIDNERKELQNERETFEYSMIRFEEEKNKWIDETKNKKTIDLGQKFDRDRIKIDSSRIKISPKNSPQNQSMDVELNVRGEIMKITRSSINHFKSTKLIKFIESATPDEDKRIYFDRNPKYFRVVIQLVNNYQTLNMKMLDNFSNDEKKIFFTELVFWGLNEIIDNIEDEPMSPPPPPNDDLEKLIIIGGHDGNQWLDIVDIFDFGASKWTTANPMNFKRCFHSGTRLNNKVYIFGGFDGKNTLANAESIDVTHIKTANWIMMNNMPLARCFHSVVVFPNPTDPSPSITQDIYILGGDDGKNVINKVHSYNISTGLYQEEISMILSRCALACVSIDNKIFAIGGMSGDSQLDTIEVYDSNEQSWNLVMKMPQKRSDMASAYMNGKIYIMGGHNRANMFVSCLSFDPNNFEFENVANLSSNRARLCSCVVNDILYVIGGHDGQSRLNLIEFYDEKGQIWRSGNNMLSQRYGMIGLNF